MQWARIRIVLCLISVALVCTLASTVNAQSRENDDPWKVSNKKALDATTGQPPALDELADDVLNGNLVLQMLSANDPDLKLKLSNAERNYREKKHASVSDEEVAKAANALARLIDAPPFAYTDKLEVRRLRMKMVVLMPALFAQRLRSDTQKDHSAIREGMSPIESMYLLAALIDQKMSNPDFQLTSQERRDKWEQLRQPAQEPSATLNRRTNELENAISLAASKSSLRDISAAGSDIVGKLVDRRGGK